MGFRTIDVEISFDDYVRYTTMPHREASEEIKEELPPEWIYGYGYYGWQAINLQGKYYLRHTIGSSCD